MRIEELDKEIEFHDLPLSEVNYSFEKRELILKIAAYNEGNQNYDYYNIIFNAVEKLIFDCPEKLELKESNGNINTYEVSEINEVYSIKIVILLNLNGPPAILQFSYTNIKKVYLHSGD